MLAVGEGRSGQEGMQKEEEEGVAEAHAVSAGGQPADARQVEGGPQEKEGGADRSTLAGGGGEAHTSGRRGGEVQRGEEEGAGGQGRQQTGSTKAVPAADAAVRPTGSAVQPVVDGDVQTVDGTVQPVTEAVIVVDGTVRAAGGTPPTASSRSSFDTLWAQSAASALWGHWAMTGQFDAEGRPFRFTCTG